VSEESITDQIVLGVFPPGEDRTSLDQILVHSEWQLQFACTLEETRTALRAFPFTVILSEGHLSDGHCWKDVLHALHGMSNPPALIVADRLADDALWGEVLNLGGYDLLTKPFNAREVLHAVTTACHFCVDQRQRAATLRKPPKSTGSESTSETTKRAAARGQ
jgi:DNA-binding response OmpR family regulator